MPPPRPRHVASTASPFPVDRTLELVGTTVEALASGRCELDHLVASDARVRTPTFDCCDRDALTQRLRSETRSFSDIAVDVTGLVAAASHVGAEWTLRADHTHPIDVGWARLAPTGQSVAVDGLLIGRVDGRPSEAEPLRFADLHLVYDTTSLLIQLGLA